MIHTKKKSKSERMGEFEVLRVKENQVRNKLVDPDI